MLSLLVATYAIARLIQVPIEHGPGITTRYIWLWVVTAPAVLVIAWLAMQILQAGVNTSLPDIG